MNAEQLADGMESVGHHNTAAMLRKQAKAIKLLRDALALLERNCGIPVIGDNHVKQAARAALAATEDLHG